MSAEIAATWESELTETLKAVIFDFDGVILESADIKTEAFLELFSDYPEHQEAILRYHLDNVGISRFQKFDWIYTELLRSPLDAVQARNLGDAFSEIIFDKIIACPLVPGALDLLKQLHLSTKLFVASGTPQEELELVVHHRGLKPYFREIWGSPERKADIIRTILDRYNLAREEVLFVGDGISDYRAASETGIPFFARKRNGMSQTWDELGVMGGYDLTPIASLFSGGAVPDA